MKKSMILGLMAMVLPVPCLAQIDESDVVEFTPELFGSCFDPGQLRVVNSFNDPLSVIGSVIYRDTALFGGEREIQHRPISLPIIVSDATSPDNQMCDVTFKNSTGGSVEVFGVKVAASDESLFRVTTTLVARQRIAEVPQDGYNLQAWEAKDYRQQFKTVGQQLGAFGVTDMGLVNNVSIYLLEIEKFDKKSGGIFSVFGGGEYQRDSSFRGNKLLISGDFIKLKTAFYEPGGIYGEPVASPPPNPPQFPAAPTTNMPSLPSPMPTVSVPGSSMPPVTTSNDATDATFRSGRIPGSEVVGRVDQDDADELFGPN